MKFLSLVIAAIVAAPAVAESAKSHLDYWSSGSGNAVFPTERLLGEDGVWKVPVVAVDKSIPLSRYEPIDETARRKLREWKEAKAQKNRESGRRLQGPALVEPQNKDMITGGTVTFAAAGLDGLTDVKIVLKNGDAELPIPVKGDIVGGEMTEEFTGLALGQTYTWRVEGKNAAGDIVTTSENIFTYAQNDIVRRSGSTTVVTEASYNGGGQVLRAVGRIYFSSFDPENDEPTDFACTGTLIYDNKIGRSIVLTAAHCVWDDIWEQWGHNAIFIPERDSVQSTIDPGDWGDLHRPDSSGSTITDKCGWWSLSGGVVHDKWRDTPWPERLDYDYGFWIVDDTDPTAHKAPVESQKCGSDILDIAIDAMDFKVGVDVKGEFANNFGYSLEYNPDFRYCAEGVTDRVPVAGVTSYWMDKCALSGGSSGGPWILDFDQATGSGTVVSVNSWSYSARDGMGAPMIDASEARCLMNAAREIDAKELIARPDGDEGEFINCYERPCIPDDTSVRKLRGSRELCSGAEDEKN